jgi:hypothetical protein
MEKVINEYGPRIEEAESFVQEAHSYLMDITDELAKHESELRIDQDATAKVGSTCITIRSLEEWAGKRYRKPEISSTSDNEESSGAPDDSLKDGKNINSLYVTLGLAIRAIAEAKGPQFGTPDNEVITQIAELLEKHANALGHHQNRPLASQKYESIRKRLTEAKKRLHSSTRNA